MSNSQTFAEWRKTRIGMYRELCRKGKLFIASTVLRRIILESKEPAAGDTRNLLARQLHIWP